MVELEEKYSFRVVSFVVKNRNLYQTEGLHLKLFVLRTELTGLDWPETASDQPKEVAWKAETQIL
jgi:hypothetical protein